MTSDDAISEGERDRGLLYLGTFLLVLGLYLVLGLWIVDNRPPLGEYFRPGGIYNYDHSSTAVFVGMLFIIPGLLFLGFALRGGVLPQEV